MADSARYCETCGQRLPSGAETCPFCGAAAPGSGAVSGVGTVAVPNDADRGSHFRASAAKEPELVPGPAEGVDAIGGGTFDDASADDDSERELFSLKALEGDAGVRPYAAEASERKPRDRAPLSEGAKRKVKRAAVGIGVAAVFAIVIGVGLSWKADADLKMQAEQAAAQKAEEKPDAKADDADASDVEATVSSEAQAGVGGSSVVSDGVNLYWAGGDGIYALSEDDAVDNEGTSDEDDLVQPKRIIEDAASCLNVCGDDLYYLSGNTVKRVEDVRKAVSAASKNKSKKKNLASAKELYTAGADVSLTALVVRGDTVLALEMAPGKARIISVAEGASVQVYEADATAAWLFADTTTVTLVTSTDAAWQAGQAPLASMAPGVTFQQVFNGEGSMQAACFAGRALYQSVKNADGQVKVSKREVTGSYNEYTDLTGTVLLFGCNRGCIAVTGAGGLAWIDADTGFSRDLTPALAEVGVTLVPTSTMVWCDGTTVYLLADTSSGAGTLRALDVSMDPATVMTINGSK